MSGYTALLNANGILRVSVMVAKNTLLGFLLIPKLDIDLLRMDDQWG